MSILKNSRGLLPLQCGSFRAMQAGHLGALLAVENLGPSIAVDHLVLDCSNAHFVNRVIVIDVVLGQAIFSICAKRKVVYCLPYNLGSLYCGMLALEHREKGNEKTREKELAICILLLCAVV